MGPLKVNLYGPHSFLLAWNLKFSAQFMDPDAQSECLPSPASSVSSLPIPLTFLWQSTSTVTCLQIFVPAGQQDEQTYASCFSFIITMHLDLVVIALSRHRLSPSFFSSTGLLKEAMKIFSKDPDDLRSPIFNPQKVNKFTPKFAGIFQ